MTALSPYYSLVLLAAFVAKGGKCAFAAIATKPCPAGGSRRSYRTEAAMFSAPPQGACEPYSLRSTAPIKLTVRPIRSRLPAKSLRRCFFQGKEQTATSGDDLCGKRSPVSPRRRHHALSISCGRLKQTCLRVSGKRFESLKFRCTRLPLQSPQLEYLSFRAFASLLQS